MKSPNLADKIKRRLPAPALRFIEQASRTAHSREERVYLVGGAVRDLLLGKPVLDIDLVVEGDAIALATELSKNYKVSLTIHKPFLTANLKSKELNVDVATARSESYARPGALPTARRASLQDDLKRRDFSINAVAVSLNKDDFGALIDIYGGLSDLKAKLVRVLHDKSFTDDATRIWRAMRYEQRLGFEIESETLRLLKRDLDRLETISGERIRYELECVLSEAYPEKALIRAAGLGILKRLHPKLALPRLLAKWFANARRIGFPPDTLKAVYLALLTYNPNAAAIEQFADYLKLDKKTTQVLKDTRELKRKSEALDDEPLQPSAIYLVLHEHSEEAILANLISAKSGKVRHNMQLYLDELRYVKTSLDGDDLVAIGLRKGPLIKMALDVLLDARLDGDVNTRRDEEQLVRNFFL